MDILATLNEQENLTLNINSISKSSKVESPALIEIKAKGIVGDINLVSTELNNEKDKPKRKERKGTLENLIGIRDISTL